jgi:hypothetical protein
MDRNTDCCLSVFHRTAIIKGTHSHLKNGKYFMVTDCIINIINSNLQSKFLHLHVSNVFEYQEYDNVSEKNGPVSEFTDKWFF